MKSGVTGRKTTIGPIDVGVLEDAEALNVFSRRQAAVPMPGRTHQQPALPNFVGLWADAESLHGWPTL